MKRTPPGNTPLFVRLAASFFFIGEAAPFAPATFASLAVTPAFLFFVAWPAWIQIALTLAVIWVAILVSTRAEFFYGHDAKAIVIDEVAGMMVTFLLVPPMAGPREQWFVLILGFFLFRVFDVLKPFPANRAQNLPRGTGVVLDDVVAGIYANAGVRIVIAFSLVP